MDGEDLLKSQEEIGNVLSSIIQHLRRMDLLQNKGYASLTDISKGSQEFETIKKLVSELWQIREDYENINTDEESNLQV